MLVHRHSTVNVINYTFDNSLWQAQNIYCDLFEETWLLSKSDDDVTIFTTRFFVILQTKQLINQEQI